MIDEMELYSALGVEAPATGGSTGGEAQVDAGPAGQSSPAGQGAAAQEPKREPAGEPEGNDGGASAGDGGRAESGQNGPEGASEGDGTGGGKKPPQSREERARFAAMRRKAEVEAAVQKALEEQEAKNRRQWDSFFATAGLKDPVSGKAITNLDEYTAYQREAQSRRIQENLRKGKLLPEDIQAMIASEMAARGRQSEAQAKQSAGEGAQRQGQPPAAREASEEQISR